MLPGCERAYRDQVQDQAGVPVLLIAIDPASGEGFQGRVANQGACATYLDGYIQDNAG